MYETFRGNVKQLLVGGTFFILAIYQRIKPTVEVLDAIQMCTVHTPVPTTIFYISPSHWSTLGL